jgi:peptidoglycan/xylan/chitin deacetylase (PgdA/CDA1 family)
MAQVKNGSIILLHDGDGDHDIDDRCQTVAALPELITELRAKGYQLVTIPELLNLDIPQQKEKFTVLSQTF